jgi:membrane protein
MTTTPNTSGSASGKNGSGKARQLMDAFKAQFEPLDPHKPLTFKFAAIVRRGAERAQIPRMAAALSYRTIFGLIPMIVVSLVVLAAFAKPEDVTKSMRQLMKFAGLSEIVVEEKAPDEIYHDIIEHAATHGPVSTPEMLETEESLAPEKAPVEVTGEKSFASVAGTKEAAKLDQWIEGLVDRVRSIRLDALGAVGLAMLLYAAISMMVEIEKAFNHIFMAPSGRSWTRRVPMYWTMLTLGSICMAGTFSLQELVRDFVDTRIGANGVIGSTAAVIGVYGVTTLVSTLLLVVMYTTIPNTNVKFNAALIGAVIAAIAWEAAKWGFAEYVRFSAGTARLYGLIALLPLFLLWVYLTWMIVLTGLQIAHSLQTYGLVRERGVSFSLFASLGLLDERVTSRVTGVVDAAAILPVMLAVAEGFEQGRPTDHATAAKAVGLDERVVSEMLERLAGAGLLHRVRDKGDGAYTLAKSPKAILASDVLRVGDDVVAVARPASSPVMRDLANARIEAFGSKSLSDLLAKPAVPSAQNLTPVMA